MNSVCSSANQNGGAPSSYDLQSRRRVAATVRPLSMGTPGLAGPGGQPAGNLSASALTRTARAVKLTEAGAFYLASHGAPRTPQDLSHHAIIGSAGNAGWVLRSIPGSFATRSMRFWKPPHGLARLLSCQVAPAVAEEMLKIVLEDYEAASDPIHVTHPDGRRASAKARAFVDLAVERMCSWGWPAPRRALVSSTRPKRVLREIRPI